MNPTRVLIVEDSLTVRAHLRQVLAADPELEVVGEAAEGAAAVALCAELRPDVVTMDLVMQGMSGLDATEQIMANCPVPILVVSAPDNRRELVDTFEALSAGAVDALDKPDGISDPEWGRRLAATLKLVARVAVIHHPRARLGGRAARPRTHAPARGDDVAYEVVAIGTSTGGPAAVVDVLRALPPDFGMPILLVIHIGESFALGFAEWLAGQTRRVVRYGTAGERLGALGGQVVMAPPGVHMTVRARRLHLEAGPERHSCRPSIDVLFESLAPEYGRTAVAGLLTGMGTDGACGLLEMRGAGALTIAQDEATSVVYGMPRQAALIGAAELVLPLEAIGAEIGGLRSSIREVVHRA